VYRRRRDLPLTARSAPVVGSHDPSGPRRPLRMPIFSPSQPSGSRFGVG
jgi:hypothetical protein